MDVFLERIRRPKSLQGGEWYRKLHPPNPTNLPPPVWAEKVEEEDLDERASSMSCERVLSDEDIGELNTGGDIEGIHLDKCVSIASGAWKKGLAAPSSKLTKLPALKSIGRANVPADSEGTITAGIASCEQSGYGLFDEGAAQLPQVSTPRSQQHYRQRSDQSHVKVPGRWLAEARHGDRSWKRIENHDKRVIELEAQFKRAKEAIEVRESIVMCEKGFTTP
ncbi:hypothetical protein M427DRAFT_358157 [Gonapodya prolifera JEL478]|uniref:Uncharacterized protein n=1 Tax=Gonapodya prolifera (strain JEL478) TaxID=1344416 RepID=A0A139AAV5_GONPJ|nr:hypothetical protein M427DRAFT_358157 [Gonapodya prolifera JEL478]|eukprot:KXS13838.1 hypothetical protein M427DRAFT_358157 [Gonapodya prolifera JEL478]